MTIWMVQDLEDILDSVYGLTKHEAEQAAVRLYGGNINFETLVADGHVAVPVDADLPPWVVTKLLEQ